MKFFVSLESVLCFYYVSTFISWNELVWMPRRYIDWASLPLKNQGYSMSFERDSVAADRLKVVAVMMGIGSANADKSCSHAGKPNMFAVFQNERLAQRMQVRLCDHDCVSQRGDLSRECILCSIR